MLFLSVRCLAYQLQQCAFLLSKICSLNHYELPTLFRGLFSAHGSFKLLNLLLCEMVTSPVLENSIHKNMRMMNWWLVVWFGFWPFFHQCFPVIVSSVSCSCTASSKCLLSTKLPTCVWGCLFKQTWLSPKFVSLPKLACIHIT